MHNIHRFRSLGLIKIYGFVFKPYQTLSNAWQSEYIMEYAVCLLDELWNDSGWAGPYI